MSNVISTWIKDRVANQAARTAAGVASGSIDSGELQQLRQQRQGVASDLNAYKANDGRVDLQERVAVHKDLNQISQSIRSFRSQEPAPAGLGQPGSGPSGLGQKESFTASITGDPHFAVDGQINGEQVSARFDNQDLGKRTQYAGAGFRLETETVPWGSNGAAVVGSATTSTGFGRNQKDVTVNADGSVLVDGNAVSLEAGESMRLNGTSSLSANDDGSYTVSSRNGKVTNTFDVNEHENGNYINIESSVQGVQTVGWLQQQV